MKKEAPGLWKDAKNWIGRLSTAVCALLMIAGLWAAWGTKEAPEPIAYAASPASHQAVPMAYHAEAAAARSDSSEPVSIEISGVKKEAVAALAAQGIGSDTGEATIQMAAAKKPDTGKPSPGAEEKKADKVVYLTFDDGPSAHTKDVLDILAKEQVKATFFVLGQNAKRDQEMVRTIAEAGHAIGNHSYNHEYKELYGSFREFWSQIRDTGKVLEDILGYEPRLVRAPGGTAMNFDKQYFELMRQAGYLVYDWHVDSGDSKRRGVPAKEIASAVKQGALLKETVVLMHDGAGHGETVKALPEIIRYYKDKGYTFGVLSPEVEPVQFHVASTKRWARSPVGSAWIEANVQPVHVSGPVKPEPKMVMDVHTDQGSLHLEPDQFLSYEDATYVPLRMLVRQLGGTVRWNAEANRVDIDWNGKGAGFDLAGAQLVFADKAEAAVPLKTLTERSLTWVPLRDVLHAFGVQLTAYELTPLQEEV
ncbi:polysaccharide deacetylase [Paenibacillus dendritiformis]|uniref:polysaccharide deacetylase n=1 Tax=Paenibacillus dendritiformis TaxID=130049 RepID=UPI00143D2CBF|nr:polysaccharide deacetylase [Paenibacillus dendritiformis]NKI23533.1 polysaccharide deacetylase [Paenibacillus dendritiformis]NRG01313.1 polysaccharide deacetylase family protein [Paenibacillus dendritiformis]